MRRTIRRLVVLLAALGMTLALVAPAAAHDDKPQLPPLEFDDGHLGLFVSENVEYVTGRQGWTGGHVAFDNDWMYVGSYGIGMRVYDISDGENPELIGEWLPVEPRADAVPAAATFDGRRIAALNGTSRLSQPQQLRTDRSEFFDFSDPENPVLLHEFVGQDDGEAHVGHFVVGQRLWVPAGGAGAYGGSGGVAEELRPDQDYDHHRGLRLYDISPLLDADPEDCDAHAEWDNPCAPELLFAANPVELWENSPYRNGRDVGHDFTHTHDATPFEGVHVEGLGVRDLLLLAEGGSYLNDEGNTGSAFVIDITDPTDPVVLLRFIHPGYDDDREHDPIRYYHEARLLDGDPTVMMITDEDMHSGCDDGGAIYFVQLSADYTEATPLSEWHIPTDFVMPVCSVHNFTTDGNLVYIGSYNAGLQILDASDPTNPERVGYFIAEGTTAWGAYYNDGLVYVGDMTRGLDVFRFAPEDDPDATDDGNGDDDNGDDDDEVVAAPDDEGDLPVTGGQGWLVLTGLLALALAALARRRLHA